MSVKDVVMMNKLKDGVQGKLYLASQPLFG